MNDELVGRGAIWLLIVVLMGMSLWVLREYFAVWRFTRTTLPLHVWTVAGSYYLLLLSLFTRPTDWRAAIYLPALLLGIFSMAQFLRRRPPGPPDPEDRA